MMTHVPTGGPAGDLETLLRTELGAVADAVGADGRLAPTTSLLARGRMARRRRQALAASGAAAATALALVVGFTLASPGDQARTLQPAGPVRTGASMTPAALTAWVRSLPAGTANGDLRAARSSENVVRWGGRTVTLPQVPGRTRFAIPFGSSDRGLLVSWFSDRAADSQDFGMELGWLSADGRTWKPFETVMVTNAAFTADGSRYAYTGKVKDAATGKVTNELVVRRTRDDKVVARATIDDRRYVLGWLGGEVAARDLQGSELYLYDEATLAFDRTMALDKDGNGTFASIAGSTIQYLTPGSCPETEQTGPMSVYSAVVIRPDGTTSSLELGCAPDDMQFVSPDGRWVVRPGDEATIRWVETGHQVGAVNPTGWPTGTVAIWEPDSKHVQVVSRLDGDSATVVRCAVIDGRCVRIQ